MPSARPGRIVDVVRTLAAPAARSRLAALWRRYRLDAAVAVAVAGAQVGLTAVVAGHQSEPITGLGIALLAAGGLALVWRRRWPVAVLVATTATTLWYAAGTTNPGGPIWDAIIVAFGTAVYLRKRIEAILCLVVGFVGSEWGPVLFGTGSAPSTTAALAVALGLLVLLAAAEGIRLQHERSEAQRAGREQEALRRASEERIRIARDLHDVVAHNISVINVQANAGLHLMDRDPEQARAALSTIYGVSKHTLVELRSLLGVLRSADEDAPREPAPSLSRLAGLLGTARAAGLDVTVESVPLGPDLPEPVDVAAYRIVQEALTNAARHAAGSRARVRIDRRPSELLVQVDDDGGTPAPDLVTDGAGSGIIGMTERAQALGGTLVAGPRPGRGFSVEARLPLDDRLLVDGERARP